MSDDGESSLFAIQADGRARVKHRGPGAPRNERYRTAVSGIPSLVRAGRADDAEIDRIGAALGRHPRTAVGVSRDGHTVFLVVVDGRRGGSRGLNLYELADFLADIGAHDAINLDGGGSSAMYLRRASGVINAPSGGRWEARVGLGADEVTLPAPSGSHSGGERRVFVRGVEREVMNHLGVVAPEHPPLAAVDTSILDLPVSAPGGTVILPARTSRMRFGRFREALRWALPLSAGLVGTGAMLWILWRRRRRLAA